ncbi:putative TIM-barrel fold metal-dependent hydrolase [Glaciihabitans sp. UYNi722]
MLRVIGLEEHFVTEALLEAGRGLDPDGRDLAFGPASEGETSRLLLDLGDERLRVMGETGVDVAVLSLTTPGLQNLSAAAAVRLQTETNDQFAQTVRAKPNRFQGLAALVTQSGEEAAKELRRAVEELGLDGAMLFGRTGDKSLDHPDFWSIFETAEALRVPIHLHPQSPPAVVRDAYYAGFGKAVSDGFATHGVGLRADRTPGRHGRSRIIDGRVRASQPLRHPVACAPRVTCGGRRRSSAPTAFCSRRITHSNRLPGRVRVHSW